MGAAVICSTCQVDKSEEEIRPSRRKEPDRYVQDSRQCNTCYRVQKTLSQRRRRAAAEKMTERVCSRCQVLKTVDQFIPQRPYCRECRAAWQRDYVDRNREKVLAQSKAWRRRNPGRTLAYKLRDYGLTVEDYNILVDTQNGTCAVCAEACPTGKRLAVDHDHVTGRVRGLLCARCNAGLGYFLDAPDRMKAAITYLEKWV